MDPASRLTARPTDPASAPPPQLNANDVSASCSHCASARVIVCSIAVSATDASRWSSWMPCAIVMVPHSVTSCGVTGPMWSRWPKPIVAWFAASLYGVSRHPS